MKEPQMPGKVYRVRLSPAGCSLDMGDGSERGAYVGQDYLLSVLRRPHRSINLMYCYYPRDKKWPLRASHAYRPKTDFAWSYPYDDYFPYLGGPGGTTTKEPFTQIRDVRRHGQDVTLTLTLDCSLPDHHLKTIARELKPYGRLRLRINHECDGNWFAFNKMFTRPVISGFFIRFNAILKSIAPEVRTICCWGSVDHATGRLAYEDDLVPMLAHADLWSIDKYLALHYAWPNNVCEPGQKGTYTHTGVEQVWREMNRVYEVFVERSGQKKPLEICELNSDGDVAGPANQAKEMGEFYRRVLRERPRFLKGITCYQFRDHGRLGLEQEDPNDISVGIRQPFMEDYLKLSQDPYFLPQEHWSPLKGALSMEWRGSEDSDGIGWKVPLRGCPGFFELVFEKDTNLMVRAGKRWFYKKPGVERIDLTAACAHLKRGDVLPVAVFAPPAEGINPGGAASVRTRLTPPTLRLRYPREWEKK